MASRAYTWFYLAWLLLLCDGVAGGQPAFSTTVGPPTDTYQERRIPCSDGDCLVAFRVHPLCVNGYCECDSPYYSRVSCLPTVGPCNVRKNDVNNLHATPRSTSSNDTDVFTCIGNRGDRADVHVLGVYRVYQETAIRPPRPGPIDVAITPASLTRPVVLVLTNYDPVNWRLDHPLSLNIEKVILISFSVELSSVTSTHGIRLNLEKRGRGAARGWGDDTDFGNTAGMLHDLMREYGTVTSLAGTYRAYRWDWTLPPGRDDTPVIQSTASSTSVVPLTDSYEDPRISCWKGECYDVVPLAVLNQCVNGYCECDSPIYSRLSCLPSAGSCRIRQDDPSSAHAKPRYAGSLYVYPVYSCIGDRGSVADVHVLGVHEGNSTTWPPSPGTMNVVITSISPTRPVILVLSSFESINWILDYPASLTIKAVILFSHYSEASSVTSSTGINLIVEKWDLSYGYGTDIGGGRTAQLLRGLALDYGTVTSFAGTYQADHWDWTLPLGREGTRSTPTSHRPTEGYGDEFSDESSAGYSAVTIFIVGTPPLIGLLGCAFFSCRVYASSKRRDTLQRAEETRRRAVGIRPTRKAFVHSGPPVHAPLSSTSVNSVSCKMDKPPSYAEVVADSHLYPR